MKSIPGLVRTKSHELVVWLVVYQPLLPGAEGVPQTGSSPAPVVLWVVVSNFTVMMDNTTTLQSGVCCCSYYHSKVRLLSLCLAGLGLAPAD